MTKLLQLKRPEDITFSMLKFQPANELEVKTSLQLAGLGEVPEGFVAGWASTPDLDSYRHVVKTGAFDESISARGLNGPKSVKLLLGHDWDKIAGVIRVLETRQGKLWIEAQLNLNISYARDAYEAMKMAGGINFSVGFMLQDYAFKEDTSKSEYLYIEKGDLFEVSLVAFPGNEECTMDVIKSRDELKSIEDQKKILEEKKRIEEEPEPVVSEEELATWAATDAELKSVAEFEKSLMASGLVRCRKDAKRISWKAKFAEHLFKPEPPKEEKSSESLLTSESLSEITGLVAKMRDLLAPVAK